MRANGLQPRSGRGFTLAELTVWLVLYALVATTVLGTMILAVRAWSASMARVHVQQTVRLSLSAMAAEVREGIVDPDPGGALPSTGFAGISPAVAATAILMPNANSINASELTLTVPFGDNYDPSRSGWSSTDPSNYRRIRYYMKGAALHREQVTWSSSGAVAATVDDVLAAPTASGTLQFSTTYLSPTSVTVTLYAAEGTTTYTLTQSLEVFVR